MILDVCISGHWTLQQVAAMQQAMQPVQVGQAFAGRAPQSQSYRWWSWIFDMCCLLAFFVYFWVLRFPSPVPLAGKGQVENNHCFDTGVSSHAGRVQVAAPWVQS